MNHDSTPENQSQNPANGDGCPPWAEEMIAKILVLEVEAGTIKSPAGKASTKDWSTTKVDELLKIASRLDRSGADGVGDLSAEIEAIFVKTARRLRSEGHGPDAIATMINARIPTGCRLPYCNTDEVLAALSAD